MKTNTIGPARGRGPRAFSLIELVVVLLLLGIVAVVAAPSIHQSLLEYEVDRAASDVRAMIRYARSCSVTGASHSVVFDIGSNRMVVEDEDTGTTVIDPVKKHGEYDLTFGESGTFEHVTMISADFDGGQEVIFDRLGSADNSGTVLIAAGPFTRTIRVTGPGGSVTID